MDTGQLGEIFLGEVQPLAFSANRNPQGSARQSCCLWHGITSSILPTIDLQTFLYTRNVHNGVVRVSAL